MLTLFAAAFVLGLVFNAAPGAVFAETIRQGLRGGYRSALAVQLGSLVGDASWAVLGLVAIGLALQWDALRWPVGLAGAVYLAYLSWDSWQAAKHVHEVKPEGASDLQTPLRAGVLLSLTNPQNLADWAAMGGAMGAVGVVQPTVLDYAVFFAGFMVSSLLWCFVCAALVDRVFRRAGAGWARFTYRLCAAVLLVLALGTLRDLMRPATDPRPTPKPAVMSPAGGS
jgi:chemosensory pili system protein ChpE/L-lysine exporter family protein LysE/ArgO